MFSQQAVQSSKLQALLAAAGVRLGPKQRVHVQGARASDGSWSTPGLTSPRMCAPIFGASGVVWTGSFYIKVGGDRSKTRGWDNGVLDKCCVADAATSDLQESAGRTDAQRCLVFNSAASCEAALHSANCTTCSGDEADHSLSCPQWSDSAHVEITTHSELGSVNTTSVLAEFTNEGGTAVPAVIESPLGQGRIVVLLVDDVPTLQVRHTHTHTHNHGQRLLMPTQCGSSCACTGIWALASDAPVDSGCALPVRACGPGLRRGSAPARAPPTQSASLFCRLSGSHPIKRLAHWCRCSSCSITGQSLCPVGSTSMLH